MNAWGKEMGAWGRIDLQPVTLGVTAKGRGTTQWKEQEQIRRDPNRGLMLAVLWQAADDYHQAKKVQQRRQIRSVGQCARLPKWEREIILHGERAFAWFKSELGEGKGLKYNDICNYFHVSPRRLWWRIKNSPNLRQQLGIYKQSEITS